MVSCIDAKLQQKVAEYLLSAAFSLWSFLCCDSHYLYALASCNPTAIPRQPHGRCFHVHKPQDFVEQIMPKYFRQSKLTSFQRQLNLYGFSRITAGDDRGGYYHELFLRNKVFLCQNMVRRCDCASLLPWLPQSTCTHFLHLFANNIPNAESYPYQRNWDQRQDKSSHWTWFLFNALYAIGKFKRFGISSSGRKASDGRGKESRKEW